MTEIVLTCINTLRNRGVEALLLSIVQGLEERFENPRITLLTRDVEGAKESLAALPEVIPVTVIPDSACAPPVDAPAMKKTLFRLKRALRMQVMGKLTPAEAALAKADLVIASGGDVFSSDYAIMERYLRQYDQVVGAGIPLLFLGQSIGPFKTEAERVSFAGIAARAHTTVRETISQKYLTETLRILAERVTLTADPAFLLAVPEDLRARMLGHYGLTRGRFAACAISRGISLFKGLDHPGHVAAWVEAVKVLLESHDQVVMVPHVQLPQAEEDDLTLAQEVRSAMGGDPRVVVMDRLHSSIEFKAVLGAANFAIAERTHGAIGAMSSGVPTLSVGYSIKSEGVLRQLVPDAVLYDRVIVPVPEFTPAAAAEITRAAYAVRGAMAEALAANLPAVRERSRLNFEIAKRIAKR